MGYIKNFLGGNSIRKENDDVSYSWDYFYNM